MMADAPALELRGYGGGVGALPYPVKDRVPVQWIGQARVFCRRVAASDKTYEQASEQILQPLRPRPGFTPMPRHRLLRGLADAWRPLPGFARLRLIAAWDQKNRKLNIADLRMIPIEVESDTWAAGETEPGLCIIAHALTIQPPAFTENKIAFAALGLHALARRYQRCPERDDAAIKADLLTMSVAAPEILRKGGEFVVHCAQRGRWCGAVDETGIALVRTFKT